MQNYDVTFCNYSILKGHEPRWKRSLAEKAEVQKECCLSALLLPLPPLSPLPRF